MELSFMSSSATSSTNKSFIHPTNKSVIHPKLNSKSPANCRLLLPTAFSLTPRKKYFLAVVNSRRKLVIAGAKKRKNKPDAHSFVVKPDEATGPYPEAVLLKQKKVREDGKALPEFADAEEEQLYEILNLQLESDLNVERMRHYEVVYLIHEDHVDELENVNAKVQDFIGEKKGKIWRLNNWGLRKLAYKIRKAKNANYMLMNFEIEAKYINDFKNMLDKDERIIRHLVIKRDEAITEDCPPPLEFHSLRAGMDDDYDDEGDEEDEEEVGVIDGGQDWDGEAEPGDQDVTGNFNIILVDDDEEDGGAGGRKGRNRKPEEMLRQ